MRKPETGISGEPLEFAGRWMAPGLGCGCLGAPEEEEGPPQGGNSCGCLAGNGPSPGPIPGHKATDAGGWRERCPKVTEHPALGCVLYFILMRTF